MILTTGARRAAAGFTLIELLVVLSIIAVLLALSGVAYQKAVETRKNASTDELGQRLQPGLEGEYDAVVQQAAKEIRNGTAGNAYAMTLAYCDGDQDRARAVWTAARIRQHFPENFTEAKSPVSVYPGGPALPALTTFLGTDVPVSGGTPELQSAALLYVILAKKSAGSSGGFAADDVTNGMRMEVPFNGGSATVFRDGWGNPVAFRRWAGELRENNDEVQRAPFVDQKNTTNLDPLDTANKVAGWKLANGTQDPRAAALAQAPYYFTGLNRIISIYSPGKNAVYENFANDDMAGYRIRRLGAKGKQLP